MEWKEAIKKYAEHKSLMAKNKNPTEVKDKVISDLQYMLKEIPRLTSKNTNSITATMWRELINEYRKSKNLRWYDIGDKSRGYKGKYNDLVRCLVFAKNDFTCRYCGRNAITNPALQLQLEHIEPKSQTGDWFPLDNLACACSFCNYGKQMMGEKEFKKELIEIAKAVKNKFPEEF